MIAAFYAMDNCPEAPEIITKLREIQYETHYKKGSIFKAAQIINDYFLVP